MSGEERLATTERAAMALAEIGYAPTGFHAAPSPISDRPSVRLFWTDGPMPSVETRWRAWVVARSRALSCLACFTWERPGGRRCTRRAKCDLRGLYVSDCGADRDEWDPTPSNEVMSRYQRTRWS